MLGCTSAADEDAHYRNRFDEGTIQRLKEQVAEAKKKLQLMYSYIDKLEASHIALKNENTGYILRSCGIV